MFLESPAIFLRICERTSPCLQHLDLICVQGGILETPIPHTLSRIWLKSLRFISRVDTPNWNPVMLSPMDLSGLIALSVGDTRRLQQRPLAESLPSLKILDLVFAHTHPMDFALVPQLEVLRISIVGGESGAASETLASIRPTCRLRDIFIRIQQSIPGPFGEELDLALSQLPLAHRYTVTLEMDQSDYDTQPGFTRLRSLNILRRGELDPNWFKNLTRTLH
ncbi:hypothetical protein C8R46DRAFT_1111929 [Mycena filopes]|nr:hypothetical protein C8R46DRAFT_1111929 [Mycena filopes]